MSQRVEPLVLAVELRPPYPLLLGAGLEVVGPEVVGPVTGLEVAGLEVAGLEVAGLGQVEDRWLHQS